MVFAGIYPLDPGGFTKLEEAIRRVSLPSSSITTRIRTAMTDGLLDFH